jgi:hypothetical protein
MDRIQGKHTAQIESKQRSAFEISTMRSPAEPVIIPKAGEICPQCQAARIDYDSMLNLSCTNCDYILAGCFT